MLRTIEYSLKHSGKLNNCSFMSNFFFRHNEFKSGLLQIDSVIGGVSHTKIVGQLFEEEACCIDFHKRLPPCGFNPHPDHTKV